MNDSSLVPPRSAHRVAALLHRRYLAAFGAATALLLLNQLLVQPPLLRLESDAPVINVAGRQRMLSQRLSKAALAFVAAENERFRAQHRTELKLVLQLWKSSHQGLKRGDPALSLPGKNTITTREAFEAIEPSFRRIANAAEQLIATNDPAVARMQADKILANDLDFLRQMDRIVGLYEAEARARAARLLWSGWLVMALIVVALASVGWLVLIPASKIIEQQMSALRTAHDNLEDRVQRRTAELEQSKRDLEAEHEERLRAEERHRGLVEQLGHAARVNTMGEMAAGLAHELNQPLGAIANYVGGCIERVNSKPSEPQELLVALEKAQAAAMRAGEIVRGIRRFVSRQVNDNVILNPASLTHEAVEFVRGEAQSRYVVLETLVAPDLPMVAGDAVQIQQVLLNMIRNAFDAIQARNPVNPKVVVRVERSPSGAVSFAVADNGEGLGAEGLKRIFEPFFSTRAEGMGMGLAISRGIIEAHHGTIAATSVVGEGTTLRFQLPGLTPEATASTMD